MWGIYKGQKKVAGTSDREGMPGSDNNWPELLCERGREREKRYGESGYVRAYAGEESHRRYP